MPNRYGRLDEEEWEEWVRDAGSYSAFAIPQNISLERLDQAVELFCLRENVPLDRSRIEVMSDDGGAWLHWRDDEAERIQQEEYDEWRRSMANRGKTEKTDV